MKHRHLVDTAFAVALFGLFAGLALLVLLSGAQAYRGIEADASAADTQRTCLNFLAQKVRHYDAVGGVSAGRFGDSDSLELWENIDGTDYVTTIYCLGGKLMELFREADNDLQPESGTPLLDAAALQVSEDGGVLRIACTGTDGKTAGLALALRSEEGAA